MKDMAEFFLGIITGLAVTFVVFLWTADLGSPTYTIESKAMDEGIEYTVLHHTWIRSDTLYKTMDATSAWAIWYGLYQNREGVGYEVQPSTEVNPSDYADK